MVAVRTSGLLLDSIIGYRQTDNDGDDTNKEDDLQISSLVSEEYLQTLVKLANDRFIENVKRRDRFREALRHKSGNLKEDKCNLLQTRTKRNEERKQIRIAKELSNQEAIRKERKTKAHYEIEDNNTESLTWMMEGP